METEQNTVIDIDNVWFSFNKSPVLEGVSLTVRERDFLAVVGPNGGGKTTLLKLILGLYRSDRGTIRVFDTEPSLAAHRIGYVPQDTSMNREFPVSVLDVVIMGRLGYGGIFRRRSGGDVAKAMNALDQVDMGEFRHHRVGELSGGQRQRVFIARALAVEPDVLVLDEPTASVDAEGQATLYAVLKELNERVTIIAASHDVTGILGYADTVAFVNRTLHTHETPAITPELLEKISGTPIEQLCPVELIARMIKER